MKIMVAYDGTLQAKEALVYGMEKARKAGGEVVALHVFKSGMFIDYDASVDAEARARSDSARMLEEARALIREKGEGVRASLYSAEGDPEEEVVSFARQKKVDLLLCPPGFKSVIGRSRKALGATELSGETGSANMLAFSTKTV